MTWGVDHVTVEFGHVRALHRVSIGLAPGEITIVVGGDGAGKTTLCRTIVGLDAVNSGEVSRPPRTGYQPESSGVWADLSVVENLQFIAGAYGLTQGHARERIDELLDATELEPARNRLGRQLSGGMRQKLGVAMAVISEPQLLILDEPTTGLDPVSRLELWSFINLSAKDGRAVLVSTTYVSEAQRGNQVLALDQGRTLATGTVEEVIEAMPGRIFDSKDRVGETSWHRGHSWRVWSPDGKPVPGASEATPDLVDVVTVAALAGEER